MATARLSEGQQYVYVTKTLRLWCDHYQRVAVYDGSPLPEKPPMTYHEAQLWRTANKKTLLVKSSSL